MCTIVHIHMYLMYMTHAYRNTHMCTRKAEVGDCLYGHPLHSGTWSKMGLEDGNTYKTATIWRCPEIWVPPNHPRWDFPWNKPSSYWDTPIFMETSVYLSVNAMVSCRIPLKSNNIEWSVFESLGAETCRWVWALPKLGDPEICGLGMSPSVPGKAVSICQCLGRSLDIGCRGRLHKTSIRQDLWTGKWAYEYVESLQEGQDARIPGD